MKIKITTISLLLILFAVHCPPGQIKRHMNPGHMGGQRGEGHNKHKR